MIGAAAVRRISGLSRPVLGTRRFELGPRLRRRLAMIVVGSLVLVFAYALVLRDLSVIRVRDVSVTGLTGEDAVRARAAMTGAAREGTTLHVSREAIEKAAAAFPAIRAVEISPDFPTGMRIRVIEHRPAAVLVLRGQRVPVAGDGSILAGLPVRGPLPEVRVEGSVPPRRLGPGMALDAVHVAGAAPPALTPRLRSVVRERERGLVVEVKDGPELVFGEATRTAAKWAAAVRVLADPDATGADYVDLRIPERPAAGGLPVGTVAPVAPAGLAPGEPAAPAPATPVPAGEGGQAAPGTGAAATPRLGGAPAGSAPTGEAPQTGATGPVTGVPAGGTSP